MQVNWHSIAFNHPRCGQAAVVTEVDGRADGHIMLFGYCPKCGDMVMHEFTIEQMIAFCAIQDHDHQLYEEATSEVACAGQPS
jgi:hypothetical protein